MKEVKSVYTKHYNVTMTHNDNGTYSVNYEVQGNPGEALAESADYETASTVFDLKLQALSNLNFNQNFSKIN